MTEYGLDQNHAELIEMMEKIHKVFETNGIHYVLIYGSALGAVRHHGIIPWDNDIDIGVLRDEFDKAENALSSQLPFLYEFAEKHLEPSAPIGHVRYIAKNTLGLQNLKQYTTIDIWPLDKIPKSENGLKQVRRRALIHDFFVYRKAPDNRGKLLNFACTFVLSFLPNSFMNRMQRKTLEKLISVTEDDYYLSHNLFAKKMNYFPREVFENRSYIRFEDMNLPIPSDYDQYLTGMYGDYMTPPPEDKRITVHPS